MENQERSKILKKGKSYIFCPLSVVARTLQLKYSAHTFHTYMEAKAMNTPI